MIYSTTTKKISFKSQPLYSLTYLLIMVMALSAQSEADILHVPSDYLSIQSGIAAAKDTDTVLIADGLYVEKINFLGKDIFVTSNMIFDGDSSHIKNTIINADTAVLGFALNMSVCTFESGETLDAILSGVTIRNGSGRWIPGGGGFAGGGIYCESSSPTIRDCVIEYNTANLWGGGFYVEVGGSPFFKNCLIYRNECPNKGGGGYAGYDAEARILNCEFRENTFHGFYSFSAPIDIDSSSFIDNIPDGIMRNGPGNVRNSLFDGNFPWGGLHMANAPGVVDSCVFVRNMSTGRPAANFFNGVFELTNSVFIENETTPTGLQGGILDIRNCLIARNAGIGPGGIACGENAKIYVEQTVIAFNTSTSGSWGVVECNPSLPDSSPKPQFSCSNIFGNENGDWSHSIEGQDTLRGNFSSNPMFCDTTNGIYSFLENSPCLPLNNPCGLSIGVFDTACDVPDTTTDTTIIDTTITPPLPEQFVLHQNYPNPFNGSTTIEYEVPIPAQVKIVVYNVLGEKVAVLVDAYQDAGAYSVEWPSENTGSHGISSGVYFCSLRSSNRNVARKMIYLK